MSLAVALSLDEELDSLQVAEIVGKLRCRCFIEPELKAQVLIDRRHGILEEIPDLFDLGCESRNILLCRMTYHLEVAEN